MGLFYKAKILLKNNLGNLLELKNYQLKINESSNIKTFSLTTEMLNPQDIHNFSIGSDVEVWVGKRGETQDHIFTGVVLDFPRSLEGKNKTFEFSGADYLAKTQNIVVTEAFRNWNISDIFEYLVGKYAPFLSIGSIQTTIFTAEKLVFNDEYLFTCFERLAELIGYTFYVDKDKKIYFIQNKITRTNKTLRKNDFEHGSAEFEISTENLCNHLIAYGGTTISDDFEEYIKPDGKNAVFSLKYRPQISSNGSVQVIDTGTGTSLRVGADNLHQVGTDFDCLINSPEKLIKFDPNNPPPSTKEYKVIYRYEIPLKAEVGDPESQNLYGIQQRVEKFKDIDSRLMLIKKARLYVNRYKKPLIVGSLKPFSMDFDVNTEIKVELDELGINDYLLITEKEIEINKGKLSVSLNFEEKTTLNSVLKSFHERITDLEKKSQDEFVEVITSLEEQIIPIETVRLFNQDLFLIGISKAGDII